MPSRIARSAEEIIEQIETLSQLTRNDSEAGAAYEALRWVVGMSDETPASQYTED